MTTIDICEKRKSINRRYRIQLITTIRDKASVTVFQYNTSQIVYRFIYGLAQIDPLF